MCFLYNFFKILLDIEVQTRDSYANLYPSFSLRFPIIKTNQYVRNID